LRSIELPPGVRFKHASKSEISLIFEKAWIEAENIFINRKLLHGASVKRFSSEIHVRITVRPMDPQLSFDRQEAIAAAALDKIASRLIPYAKRVLG